jgi:high-affinity iron transporter
LWKQDASLHRVIPDLRTLVGTTPAALASKIGQDRADALMAFLRRRPDAVMQQQAGSLPLVRGRLTESLSAIVQGTASMPANWLCPHISMASSQ